MLINPILLTESNYRFGLGGWNSNCDSRFPNTNQMVQYPGFDLGSQDQHVVFGTPNPPFTPFTRQTYLLFKTPIAPGSAKALTIPLNFATSVATDSSSTGPATEGKTYITLMTSPAAGWDPFAITWNTRPAIDPNDPTIIFPQYLNGAQGSDISKSLIPSQSINRYCTFDLTKITKPIIGMVWWCQVISGLQVTNSANSSSPYQMGSVPGITLPVTARQAQGTTIGNQTRTLYLDVNSVKQFILAHNPHNNLTVQCDVVGVGTHYDKVHALILSSSVTEPALGVDLTAGAITYSIFDGKITTEPKTPCNGSVVILI